MNMSESERWYWLEKKRRKRKIKHLNITRGTISVRSSPPWWWSSASLTCRFVSQHDSHRNCMARKWKWSKTNSSTILIHDDEQILFHPRRSSSTQVILADRPLPSYGQFYWEIFMPAIYGTSIMFGIASKWMKIWERLKKTNELPFSSSESTKINFGKFSRFDWFGWTWLGFISSWSTLA